MHLKSATYKANTYKRIDREWIAGELPREGFDPIYITDSPGHVYHPHTHPETKLLVFLYGTMRVRVMGEEYMCGPGDRPAIPGNLEHSAVVGPEGCAFFWSEKL